ncbi:MAG: RRXRR domain-containing protein [Ktedonobacteraceae bacterium]
MRIPVVDTRGIALMPCTPAKARHLFKSGKARPKRNKLGLFYAQLCYEQEPDNQPLVAGVDPGSKFEGYSVVGTKDTVLNLMVEAPDHVKDAVETRRTMRRARRFRKWQRPKRFDNRLKRKQRIPPSTRSRWEAKARIIAQLLKILPLTDVVVEDVQAVTRKGKGGKWNGSFSPVQVGKEHLYRLLKEMGLHVHLNSGWQTKELRQKYGLKKTKSKSKQSFESHAVDSWVLAASVSGAEKPACTRLWYVMPAVLNRRKLHMLQAAKGGKRRPQGGTRSLGLKRGTVVKHAKYGWCTVGGFDRKKQTISLHAYRTNRRLTQGAKVETCRVLTWVAFRSWLVRSEQGKSKGKGGRPPQAPNKERLVPPPLERQGPPQAVR